MHFVWDTVVTEVLGADGQVTGVRTRNVHSGDEGVLDTDGVFIYVGHEPNTDFLAGVVELNDHGYVAVRNEIYTTQAGVFAAGDVADEVYRQLGTSVGAGTRAAMAAERWLAEQPARGAGPRAEAVGSEPAAESENRGPLGFNVPVAKS
jgi:thioredoxin reductase (NADPH)